MDNKGLDFEYRVLSFFEEHEVVVFDTPMTNDYGADLIVHFNGSCIVIQCKCYSKPVGLSAVQEVLGAIPYYKADVGMVVSNQPFTRQARRLARVNNIILVGGSDLGRLLDDIYGLSYLESLLKDTPRSTVDSVDKSRGSWLTKLFGRVKS